MPRMIFVSLPASDLSKSVAFYAAALGAVADPRFADDSAQMPSFSEAMG